MTYRIEGFCPMGCGETLFLSRGGGYVTCSAKECPRPDAVTEILASSETEHIIDIELNTYTIMHPLRERLDDELLTCAIHDWIFDLAEPPAPVGRYRVSLGQLDPSEWERLDGHE